MRALLSSTALFNSLISASRLWKADNIHYICKLSTDVLQVNWQNLLTSTDVLQVVSTSCSKPLILNRLVVT